MRTPVNRIHLCSGLLERAGRVLLVASRYPNLAEPLWHLPGGRQHDGELLAQTLVREFAEETRLSIRPTHLLYVSESYDPTAGAHFLNVTFAVEADGEPQLPTDDAHVIDLAWVARAEVPDRITVRVVREPLAAALAGDTRRYFGFADAAITIEFADET